MRRCWKRYAKKRGSCRLVDGLRAALDTMTRRWAPAPWLRAGNSTRFRARHLIFVHHALASHWCVVNSAAVQLAGFDDSTPDMPEGKFGRDGGQLNGILHEKARWRQFWPFSTDSGAGLMPIPSLEDRLLGFEKHRKSFTRSGMTSITDAFVAPHHVSRFLKEAGARAASHHAHQHARLLRGLRDSVRSLGLTLGTRRRALPPVLEA